MLRLAWNVIVHIFTVPESPMLGVVCHGQKDVRVEELAGILSGTYPIAEAVTALELAGDRSKVVKLHLALNS